MTTLLIANRGEIACRIARTARAMGMTVAVVTSDADKNAMHVREADIAVNVGAGPARESYLNIGAVVAAAKAVGATLVHPGYGFLSENAEFAAALKAEGITFVGPSARAMTAMGRKDEAKALAIKAGVPVVGGYAGDDQSLERLQNEADKIGYPVAIKAVAGGGGRGLRRVANRDDFAASLASAVREAEAGFGDGRVLLEKWIDGPRHIEVQILADTHGNTLYLGERDCTLQRRHQKVIEEAPAPGMTRALRRAMGEAAVKAAKAVDYVGAGTIEFIVDTSNGLREDGFFFMEMNTRLQVEHPVTEAITGLDLVEWQLRIARGESLPFTQDEIFLNGHAIEARIYAEDAANGFRPSLGTLQEVAWPESWDEVRIDAGYETGDTVSPFYDAMLAKVIVHADDRDTALDQLAAALDEVRVLGVKTNTPFVRRLCDDATVRDATFDTRYLDRELETLTEGLASPSIDVILASVLALLESETPSGVEGVWAATDGFELSGERKIKRTVDIDGARHDVLCTWQTGHLTLTYQQHDYAAAKVPVLPFVLEQGSRPTTLHVADGLQSWKVVAGTEIRASLKAAAGREVKAPLPGRLAAWLKNEGDTVEAGETVAILEAMKMEHALKAPQSGVLGELQVEAGSQVTEGLVLVQLELE